jgi:soluble lytic murein transglycosylase-like protein
MASNAHDATPSPVGRGCVRAVATQAARGGLAAIMFVLHGTVSAQIYMSADPNAVSGVVLSNFQSNATPVLLIDEPAAPSAAITTAPPANRAGNIAQPETLRLPPAPAELKKLIGEVAAEVQIAPELLHAVIAAESNYNSRAKSSKGAIGLMQLLPATAQRFGASDPYVARQNVMAGASYLKWLLALFQNDLELVLAAYNAGEQAVLRAGSRIPPYPETMAYVPRVMAYLRCARSAACKTA